jgi:hypothetical protein
VERPSLRVVELRHFQNLKQFLHQAMRMMPDHFLDAHHALSMQLWGPAHALTKVHSELMFGHHYLLNYHCRHIGVAQPVAPVRRLALQAWLGWCLAS